MRSKIIATSLLLYMACAASASSLSNQTDGHSDTSSNAKPVLAQNFPDPSLVKSGGSWYAFATSGNGKNIQAAVTGNFIDHNWKLLQDTDVLPDPGAWALNDGNIWAPDVIQLEDSRWIMFYAATSKDNNGSHCIGAGTSNNILGPYEPIDKPIACPVDRGGAIDPAGFKDPRTGNLYVAYKIDGNNLNTGGGACKGGGDPDKFNSTPIMLQQLDTSDGTTLVGKPFEILDRSERDEPLIEAPSLSYQPDYGLYYLTFSSNCYSTDNYDVSFAYSTDLHSTFCKSSRPVITTGTGSVKAPGGADTTGDGRFAVFHGTVGRDKNGEPVRHMFAAESEQIGIDMSVWII